MALHYYGYQSCRRSSEMPPIAGGHRRRRTEAISEPQSESGESAAAYSDLDSDSGGCSAAGSSSGSSTGASSGSSDDPTGGLPYPGIAPVALRYLGQTTRPRNWCLALISNPWFERVSMMVILLNCVTLGMYQPCMDEDCQSNRCKILQIFDDFIFAFFSLEMTIKMVAMGVYGKGTYLADSWNRLDFFIVLAGALEYCLNVENMNLSAIRTIRVLRPLRAINRIPSMRILVMLLLDTLPMLGNVLLLCFFVFFIFGIVGVQLWQGILRQRCYLRPSDNFTYPKDLSRYYSISQEQEYICTRSENSGMHACANLPPMRHGYLLCNASALPGIMNEPTNTSCVNWNQYYTECVGNGDNPFQGTISFDNIGLAWVAIFLVISLEGWTDIMYYVQDAHSFWDWIYFVLLIVIGSFFMINLCLVVIATQFSETKKREMERMRLERARFQSTSTLASSAGANGSGGSEPATCYAEIVRYIAHLVRRAKRRISARFRVWRLRRRDARATANASNINTMDGKRKHHVNCPRFGRNPQHMNVLQQSSDGHGPTTICSNMQQSGGVVSTLPSISCSAANNLDQTPTVNTITAVTSHHNNAESISGSGTVATTTTAQPRTLEIMDMSSRGPGLLRVPSISTADGIINENTLQLLSPPSAIPGRRRSSVMFSDMVLLHGGSNFGGNTNGVSGSSTNGAGSTNVGSPSGDMTTSLINQPTIVNVNMNNAEKNVCSSEKMTQTGDGNIWKITPMTAQQQIAQTQQQIANEFCELNNGETMTCQELLALSGALSAALPTGQIALDSFFTSLTKGIVNNNQRNKIPQDEDMYISAQWNVDEDFSCCQELVQSETNARTKHKKRSKCFVRICSVYKLFMFVCSKIKKYIKLLVEHKYFQQGILLAILVNTLSMGIEYHNQPEMLTVIVETSNIVFSAIFAVEMLLKVIAEGPFGYIANGFNVFDGVIVILSAVELCQQFVTDARGGSSGLSVLRTFRLLRILKLVRFMPNLRRQLFVMLRTMDNVAVFFSLLILFIFIFSILGMILFGGKFCKYLDDEEDKPQRECTCAEIVSDTVRCECDRKHFNNFLWATVTVFQILTQEDWNMVLSNGMAKTSHWAALYFVALMTFGNYVLFNLLVAILVEGFSSERNERREREQRELAKLTHQAQQEAAAVANMSYTDDSSSRSYCSEDSDSFPQGIKNTWRSAEELRRNVKNGQRACSACADKCNIQKESKMLHQRQSSIDKATAEYHTGAARPPIITHTAATPQDSPSTTLEPGSTFTGFCYSFAESLDSIDRSSCNSIPGLLKPPALNGRSASLTTPTLGVIANKQLLSEQIPSKLTSLESNIIPKLITHNEKIGSKTTTFSEKVNCSLASAQTVAPTFNDKNVDKSEKPLEKNEEKPATNEKCKIQRGYSWKMSRPSLRRKNSQKNRSGSDSDAVMILNNGRDNSQCNKNQILLQTNLRNNDNLGTAAIRIQNDTQGDTPNNKSTKGLSPQNSVRSRSSTYCAVPQVVWKQQLHRHNSLTTPPQAVPHGAQLLPHYHIQQPFVRNASLIRRMSLAPDMTHSGKHINNLPCVSDGDIITASSAPSENLGAVITEADCSGNGVNNNNGANKITRSQLRELLSCLEPRGCLKEREDFSLYLFPSHNRFRHICTWLVEQKWFDNVVLLFIALNCITLAMERPNIPPSSTERMFLSTANYVFTGVFAVEMFIKVVATGMCYGPDAYFTSGWNIMDGSLVIISIIDLLMSLISESSPRIFGILRVFRLLRSLRPLRVINRAPGLKLVVQTLLSSLRPIGNIVLICCTFFIIFGILGVQLFKGTFFYCKGDFSKGVQNKSDCITKGNEWVNQKYNFDDLGKALMSLFVLSSRDGWVNIMYTGLDAVGVDQQPVVNYSEWRLLYFISFILLVGFFVLNMFVGVVVENFHRCREEQEKEERVRRAAKRALQMEKRRRKMNEPPYYTDYSKWRLFIHNVVTSKYFDLAIAAVIGLNVVTMAMECYMMPDALEYALKIFNYFFTAVFILESLMKLLALGLILYLKDKWNQLDVIIVILSVVGIVLEELKSKIIPINPTVLRVMRVLRIARVLKLLKMAKGIRALLDTVMQALPQVGNLGLLFFLLFFIFAALGVELFGRLECSDEIPCQGLGEHAHFSNFGMAFLTLFRVATGDNWNGIMKDTLRDECDDSADCVRNCCVSTIIAPIFFVIFVLMAQFVLVNVVVAVLMKHLEESHKHLEEEIDMDTQLEREMQEQQEQQEERELCLALQMEVDSTEINEPTPSKKPLTKVLSLPSNFTYSPPDASRYTKSNHQQITNIPLTHRRRQTVHSQQTMFPNIARAKTISYPHKYENQEFNLNDEILYENPTKINSNHSELLHVQTDFHESLNPANMKKDKVEESSLMPKTSSNELLKVHTDTCNDHNGYGVKNVNETKNYEEKSLLTVPVNHKSMHKLYGSTKQLCKQKAIDSDNLEEPLVVPIEYHRKKHTDEGLLVPSLMISGKNKRNDNSQSLLTAKKSCSDTQLTITTETIPPKKPASDSLLSTNLLKNNSSSDLQTTDESNICVQLSIPVIDTTTNTLTDKNSDIKITLGTDEGKFINNAHKKKECSQEDIQKIIAERRKMDENFKEVDHFDIFESMSSSNKEVSECTNVEPRQAKNTSESNQEDKSERQEPLNSCAVIDFDNCDTNTELINNKYNNTEEC